MTTVEPATSDHVREGSPDRARAEIDAAIEARVRELAEHPERIDGRLRELDAEWDIERWLEVNGSVLAFAGTALGAFVHRRWLLLPATVVTFCAQHAIQGWCPPMELFRRLGVRTRKEIDAEKYALKALRGDFRSVAADDGAPARRAADALAAVSA